MSNFRLVLSLIALFLAIFSLQFNMQGRGGGGGRVHEFNSSFISRHGSLGVAAERTYVRNILGDIRIYTPAVVSLYVSYAKACVT